MGPDLELIVLARPGAALAACLTCFFFHFPGNHEKAAAKALISHLSRQDRSIPVGRRPCRTHTYDPGTGCRRGRNPECIPRSYAASRRVGRMPVLTGSGCLNGKLFDTHTGKRLSSTIGSGHQSVLVGRCDRLCSRQPDSPTALSADSNGRWCGEPRTADRRSTHETPTHGGSRAGHDTDESTRIHQAISLQGRQSIARNLPNLGPVGLGPTHIQTGGRKGRASPINFAIDGNGANRRDRRLHSNLVSGQQPASVRTHPSSPCHQCSCRRRDPDS